MSPSFPQSHPGSVTVSTRVWVGGIGGYGRPNRRPGRVQRTPPPRLLLPTRGHPLSLPPDGRKGRPGRVDLSSQHLNQKCFVFRRTSLGERVRDPGRGPHASGRRGHGLDPTRPTYLCHRGRPGSPSPRRLRVSPQPWKLFATTSHLSGSCRKARSRVRMKGRTRLTPRHHRIGPLENSWT